LESSRQGAHDRAITPNPPKKNHMRVYGPPPLISFTRHCVAPGPRERRREACPADHNDRDRAEANRPGLPHRIQGSHGHTVASFSCRPVCVVSNHNTPRRVRMTLTPTAAGYVGQPAPGGAAGLGGPPDGRGRPRAGRCAAASHGMPYDAFGDIGTVFRERLNGECQSFLGRWYQKFQTII
jgi:hypothetical protein